MVTTRAQGKTASSVPNEILNKLKAALKDDKWLETHQEECTMRDGLACVGVKLYAPASLHSTIL